jgi:hypothetical protein
VVHKRAGRWTLFLKSLNAGHFLTYYLNTYTITDNIYSNFTFMWPCIVTNLLIIKPTRCTNFSNLFWKWNSTCIGQFLCPSSGVIYCTLDNGICHTDSFRAATGPGWNCISILVLLLLERCLQTCMTYTIVKCTVNNSWWWTEELSDTRRISFPK